MSEMQAIDIARRLAELGQTKEACQAYTLTVAGTQDPEILLEAALYILQNDGNYQVSYDVLLQLYENPVFRQDAFAVLTEAFYLPNEKQLKTRYEKNCKLLSKYPYLFRKDFPKFEELPIHFYPFDDTLYVPFQVNEGIFQKKVNFNYPAITHYFFKNLDNPILAHDIYSQYELEYLRDNVRPSEYVGRENHIYLHYTDWRTFCAHLQVLNLRELLDSKKIVFLIEKEISRYPIDFQKEFGIDYSRYPVEPFHLEEFHKLIWHTQLASHNGGDFFNEIFDAHPNLVAMPSLMLYNINEQLQTIRDHIDNIEALNLSVEDQKEFSIKKEIFSKIEPAALRNEKNLFTFLFLYVSPLSHLDIASRIVPTIFFQPHFHNMEYEMNVNQNNRVVLYSKQYDEIQEFPPFQFFPYLKTFTPMRRPSNSAAATVRFQLNDIRKHEDEADDLTHTHVVSDNTVDRLLNRSYMVDWQDRLFQDSVLVRFEDGKLNPKATFTALAEFLDIPYTDSMTYCSEAGQMNPESLPGNDIGFSLDAIFRTYDEYLGTPERIILEYFLRDTYSYYGYDFQYYDGQPMDLEKVKALVDQFHITDEWIWETYKCIFTNEAKKRAEEAGVESISVDGILITQDNAEPYRETFMSRVKEKRLDILSTLMNQVCFVNKNGQPLNFMPRLKLDPELLEQPLYH